MTARIKTELAVGVTDEIQAALETAVHYSGIKASRYARIALVGSSRASSSCAIQALFIWKRWLRETLNYKLPNNSRE